MKGANVMMLYRCTVPAGPYPWRPLSPAPDLDGRNVAAFRNRNAFRRSALWEFRPQVVLLIFLLRRSILQMTANDELRESSCAMIMYPSCADDAHGST
mmetsp:Transcript_10610/g.33899  ORF Transcript_10610/g.33899 Transcript_10610/m.33899 type:complete len:98 (+) Transcript_10610:1582-1875(+)